MSTEFPEVRRLVDSLARLMRPLLDLHVPQPLASAFSGELCGLFFISHPPSISRFQFLPQHLAQNFFFSSQSDWIASYSTYHILYIVYSFYNFPFFPLFTASLLIPTSVSTSPAFRLPFCDPLISNTFFLYSLIPRLRCCRS